MPRATFSARGMAFAWPRLGAIFATKCGDASGGLCGSLSGQHRDNASLRSVSDLRGGGAGDEFSSGEATSGFH